MHARPFLASPPPQEGGDTSIVVYASQPSLPTAYTHTHTHIAAPHRYRGRAVSDFIGLWPTRWKDYGGYSRYPEAGSPTWPLLLDKIRLCPELFEASREHAVVE